MVDESKPPKVFDFYCQRTSHSSRDWKPFPSPRSTQDKEIRQIGRAPFVSHRFLSGRISPLLSLSDFYTRRFFVSGALAWSITSFSLLPPWFSLVSLYYFYYFSFKNPRLYFSLFFDCPWICHFWLRPFVSVTNTSPTPRIDKCLTTECSPSRSLCTMSLLKSHCPDLPTCSIIRS